jgi:hypothetical protein
MATLGRNTTNAVTHDSRKTGVGSNLTRQLGTAFDRRHFGSRTGSLQSVTLEAGADVSRSL